jgi:hypothetical protein
MLTLTVHVYNSSGSVSLDGSARGDGSQVSVYSPDTVSIQATVAPGPYQLAFGYWWSNVATFASVGASTTSVTFGSSAASGDLSLVTNETQTNWAGYSMSGKGIRSVSGEFRLPSEVKFAADNATSGSDSCRPFTGGNAEVATIWVGLGGSNISGFDLWQAGVYIGINGSGSPTIDMFVEQDPGSTTSGSQPNCPAYASTGGILYGGNYSTQVRASGWEPHLGDAIIVVIQQYFRYRWAGWAGNVTIFDVTQNQSWPGVGLHPSTNYSIVEADSTSAEWVTEYTSAELSTPGMLSISPVNWTNLTVNQPPGSTVYIPAAGPYQAWIPYDQYFHSGSGWTTFVYQPSYWEQAGVAPSYFRVTYQSHNGRYAPP